MARFITVTPATRHAEAKIHCYHPRTVIRHTPSGNPLRWCVSCGEQVIRTPSDQMLAKGRQPKS